ncbi:MAG: hypothetical protein IRZ16_05650 [Myxococcaceae bacterium]|nr:hypothetical protein [Myxococcaceae bacterium]
MKNIFLAALAALVTAVITVACGGSGDLCKDKNIRCEDPLACDPDDGICKCGGRGGVVCREGEVCDAVSNTCLSTRCAGVNCSSKPGTTCDQLDGQCKCGGTGGQICGENETCDPALKQCVKNTDCSTVACPVNEVCDPSTGSCVCGTETCGPGESCTVDANNKSCAPDNCFGVKCLGNTTCDPADGRCKCNGAVCAPGSVCACPAGSDGGTCAAEVRICQPGSACANVVCTGGTTCDPSDGQCKCGGPGGPVCRSDQVCSLTTFQCQGGEQCTLPDGGMKICPLGTSCDPEDGVCKCGGRGGEVCNSGADGGPEETCVESIFSQTCRQTCDPRFQNCPAGQFCYFDTTAKHPTAYCAVNSGTQTLGQACNNATACFTTDPSPRGLFCANLGTFDQPGSTGFCRAFCDTTVPNNQSCPTVPPHICTTIKDAAPGVGYCQPVQTP